MRIESGCLLELIVAAVLAERIVGHVRALALNALASLIEIHHAFTRLPT